MTNLKLYINKQDYSNMSGADWPSYEDFCNGVKASDKRVQASIDRFVQMMVKEGIRFPLSTSTACQSKWTWSTIYLNQLSTASCHRVTPIPFGINEFDNFHNIPKKLKDRRLMLKGQWPTGGCEYCKNIEAAGGWSDRQHNLEIRGLTPPELETDLGAVEVSPRIVEIFAQNTCNLACIYCNGNLSSKIEFENKKHGVFNRDGVTIPVIQNSTQAAKEYFDKFLDWLDRNVQTLVRLHLLGGETFVQHDLMNSVLNILERRPNPNLQLCVFSNFNVPDQYWNLYTSRIQNLYSNKHIKCFDLTASIDCWGPEQEYVRSGLDLKKFEERFAWAADQDPAWLRLNANQTVTAMTIRTMPGLIGKIKQYSKRKHIGHYFQFYTGSHMFHHPNIFSYSMWEKDFENILRSMPTDSVEQQEAIPRMQGLQQYLKTFTKHNFGLIHQLHVYLDEIDRRRSTSWRKLFPYLDIQS